MNYDFKNLSPAEFEELTRDILQRQLDIYLESFTTGKDEGIDLRYSIAQDNSFIVQCKRYSDYDSLKHQLKKESKKVNNLKPNKYLLSTSVGLTPQRKEEILSIFAPYIKSTEDIYGCDDLNNLLGLYPDIEKKHYKLWLASSNVLRLILNAKVHNQSAFQEESIRQALSVYVENDSFAEALEIISKHKYVVISGIPGIGKTTLSRILSFKLLSSGFDEFVFVSDSISEALKLFEEGKKQVFLFDDFLGKNFLETKISVNEDSRIIHFIEKIARSKDKVLILTTREYILNQAKNAFESFDDARIELAKCTIDLSKYTKLVKAKILYNHIFFSGIPIEYIDTVLKDNNYFNIVEHHNYSPRIIEAITQTHFWLKIEPSNYYSEIMNSLDNPFAIWDKAYTSHISGLSRCLLMIALSTGTPLLLEDMELAMQSFARVNATKYGLMYSTIEFKKALRELENTFIKIFKDNKYQYIIEFQNPSIRDFLIETISQDQDFIKDIISSAVFFNQLTSVFRQNNYVILNDKIYDIGKIVKLDSKALELMVSKLTNEFDYLNNSELSEYKYGNKSSWSRKQKSDYLRLEQILNRFILSEVPHLKKFTLKRIEDLITNDLESNELYSDEQEALVNLFLYFKKELKSYGTDIVRNLAMKIEWINDIKNFMKLRKTLPNEYVGFISSSSALSNKIEDTIISELDHLDSDELSDLLVDIDKYSKEFSLDRNKLVREVEAERDNKFIKEAENSMSVDYYHNPLEQKNSASDTNTLISNLFDSLKN